MKNLIVLRGNSGSGKSTIARDLQKTMGDNTMVISQDAVRRDMLNVHDKETTPALPLLQMLLRYGYENCETVILEGILSAERYRPLFELAQELYGENVHAYYFDLSFEETAKRHETRAEKNEFSADVMRSWWKEKDRSAVLKEESLTSDLDRSSIVQRILKEIRA